MYCFFCHSSNHLPQNCSKYISNEDRQRVIGRTNRCRSCLCKSKDRGEGSSCGKCLSREKCYICFSKTHHTVYCPDRVAASYLFPPKIDQDLFSRFMEMLYIEEKYLLFFTYPKLHNFINLKPLKVASYRNNFYVDDSQAFPDADLMIAEKVYIQTHRLQHMVTRKVISLPLLHCTAFRIRNLKIYSPNAYQTSKTLRSHNVLHLLSQRTKSFKCAKIQFKPKLHFSEVLLKALNLETIDIHRTNVKITEDWPNLLKNAIHLPITDINFDVKDLAALMETKSVNIFLHMVFKPFSSPNEEANILVQIAAKLSNYFILISNEFQSLLTIIYRHCAFKEYAVGDVYGSQTYKLKQ